MHTFLFQLPYQKRNTHRVNLHVLFFFLALMGDKDEPGFSLSKGRYSDI